MSGHEIGGGAKTKLGEGYLTNI